MSGRHKRGRTPGWTFIVPIACALVAILGVPALGQTVGSPLLSHWWVGAVVGMVIITGMGVFALFQPFVPYGEEGPECPHCDYDTRGLRVSVCPECGGRLPRRRRS